MSEKDEMKKSNVKQIALIGAMKRIVVYPLWLIVVSVVKIISGRGVFFNASRVALGLAALTVSICASAEERAAIAVSKISVPSSATKETESQAILRKMMEDIRHCDKSVLYEYDPNTKKFTPPELQKIKGLRFVKIRNNLAVFEINEMYEGMRARFFWIGGAGSWASRMYSIAFEGSFQDVRLHLESLWDVRFKDDFPPGPEVIEDMQYADVELFIKNKRYILSVKKRLPEDFPPIILPEVGCNTWNN